MSHQIDRESMVNAAVAAAKDAVSKLGENEIFHPCGGAIVESLAVWELVSEGKVAPGRAMGMLSHAAERWRGIERKPLEEVADWLFSKFRDELVEAASESVLKGGLDDWFREVFNSFPSASPVLYEGGGMQAFVEAVCNPSVDRDKDRRDVSVAAVNALNPKERTDVCSALEAEWRDDNGGLHDYGVIKLLRDLGEEERIKRLLSEAAENPLSGLGKRTAKLAVFDPQNEWLCSLEREEREEFVMRAVESLPSRLGDGKMSWDDIVESIGWLVMSLEQCGCEGAVEVVKAPRSVAALVVLGAALHSACLGKTVEPVIEEFAGLVVREAERGTYLHLFAKMVLSFVPGEEGRAHCREMFESAGIEVSTDGKITAYAMMRDLPEKTGIRVKPNRTDVVGRMLGGRGLLSTYACPVPLLGDAVNLFFASCNKGEVEKQYGGKACAVPVEIDVEDALIHGSWIIAWRVSVKKGDEG